MTTCAKSEDSDETPRRRPARQEAHAGRDPRDLRRGAGAAEVHRVRRQRGRARGRRDRPGSAHPARHHLSGHRTRRARLGARLRLRRRRAARCAPRRSLRAAQGARRQDGLQAAAGAGAGQHRPLDRHRAPQADRPAAAGGAAAVAPHRRRVAAQQDPRRRGHPPPLRRVEHVLRVGARPVDDLHLRVLPARRRHPRGGAGEQVPAGVREAAAASRATGCSTSAAAGAGWSATPPATA